MMGNPSFDQMKAFLVDRYKHDRLYGRPGWRECPNYGDVVVNSHLEDLVERGRACISEFESASGLTIWYEFVNDSIREVDGELARVALRQNHSQIATTNAT